MKDLLRRHKEYLLTGVSHVIPLIACGGILIALSIALVPMQPTGPDFSQAPAWIKNLNTIGTTAFTLFPAVLAGFLAFGMAGKPGLVPGLVGGLLAGLPQTADGKTTRAGFLGALLIGLVAGHTVNALKKIRPPVFLRPVMPVIVIPVLGSVAAGTLMLLLNLPLASIMVSLENGLTRLESGSQLLLAITLGGMIAFDMGGPVNKAAFFFGVAMIQQGNFAIMGSCAAAICTPPLGLGLATLLSRKNWTEEQRESGLAALGMGCVGITEGAIPFAAADPLRVIPCIMLGSMTAASIALLGGVGDHAPHGGPIVLPVVDHRLVYLGAITTGALVTALTINGLKKISESNPR